MGGDLDDLLSLRVAIELSRDDGLTDGLVAALRGRDLGLGFGLERLLWAFLFLSWWLRLLSRALPRRGRRGRRGPISAREGRVDSDGLEELEVLDGLKRREAVLPEEARAAA